MDVQLPWIGQLAAKAVAMTVKVDYQPWMQDWPLEVADAGRVEEFLTHYERERNPEHRHAIAALILASLDDAFALETPSIELLNRARPILKNYPEMIDYWSCPCAHADVEMFHITPWIRTL